MSPAVDLSHISKPEPKRNQYGHYLIPDGKKGKKAGTKAYRRVSTVAKVLDSTFALQEWGERMVARGIALDESLLAMAVTHNPDVDKKAFRDICSKAKELAKASSKRDLGTALHRSVEAWVEGAPLASIYSRHHAAIAALEREIEAKGLQVVKGSSERIVILDDLGLAGTVDFLPLVTSGGEPVIGDLKTGSVGDYSWLGWSIQTAAYAHHDATYDVVKDKRGKRVDVSDEIAIVLHLDSIAGADGEHGCTAYQVDIRQGYAALLEALDVETIRTSSKKWGAPYVPLSIGEGGGAAAMRSWLAGRIQTIAEHESDAISKLVANWPDGLPQPLPGQFLPGQPEALAKVLDAIEGEYSLPIVPSPPGMTLDDLKPASDKAREA